MRSHVSKFLRQETHFTNTRASVEEFDALVLIVRAIKLGKIQQVAPNKTGTLYQGVSPSADASKS